MKRKKKQLGALTLAIVAALFFALPMAAQVTIGSQQVPDENALLDLRQGTGSDSTSAKGLLLPRMALSSTTDASVNPLKAHVKGMLVYNTNTTTTGTNDVSPGVYYNDGSKWVATTGAQAAPAATAFKVSPEITGDYDMTDPSKIVDFLRLSPGTQGYRLTLPTSDEVPVGKILYISNIGKTMALVVPDTPTSGYPLRNQTVTAVQAGISMTIINLGGGVWDVVTGY